MTEERQLSEAQRAAWHEAGHAIVAERFGLKPEGATFGAGHGIVVHKRGSRVVEGATSWAGPMAEDLASVRSASRTLPRVPLSAATLARWHEEFTTRIGAQELSSADACGALAGGFESCELAFQVLTERWSRVSTLAIKLFTGGMKNLSMSHDEADLAVSEFFAVRLKKAQGERQAELERQLSEAPDSPSLWASFIRRAGGPEVATQFLQHRVRCGWPNASGERLKMACESLAEQIACGGMAGWKYWRNSFETWKSEQKDKRT